MTLVSDCGYKGEDNKIPTMLYDRYLQNWKVITFEKITNHITGLKENSTKIMERDEALIISCRACLLLFFFDGKKRI